MDAGAKILYLDLYRENRRGKVDDWAKLREIIEARSMPCPMTGCWLWYEGTTAKGYGVMHYAGKSWKVTRLSLLAFTGELPEGRFACHRCNVRSCVNPDHLYWGDFRDNGRDAVVAGRAGRYPTADTFWGIEGAAEGSKYVKREVTAEYLRQILHYDPLSGIFRWHVRSDVSFRVNSKHAGKRAGTKITIGYRSICIGGKRYFEHRLAWLYMKGEWPPAQIDHLNNERDDNRFENLRAATNQENGIARDQRNLRSTNKTGIVGVSWIHRSGRRTGRFYATITVDGHTISCGYHKLIEDAIAARREAEMKYRSAA